MIRTTERKPSCILTSDWHLRETVPICRTDDFIAAQWLKVGFINGLQKKYGCPVVHAGDLYDHWKPSPYLLSRTIDFLPDNFYTVYGQHDLPQHSLELAEKCGINTLIAAGKVFLLMDVHYGKQPTDRDSLFFPTEPERRVLVWHILTWQGNLPWPGARITSAHELLEKYPQFDLIVTGDNHKTFVERVGGRLLVNPGSLTRQDADQEAHEPCVFLWYAEDNTVQRVLLPAGKGVISREHIEHKQEHDKRISAFVERLDKGQLHGFDFSRNIQEFMQANKIRKSVQDIVWRALE